jgi:hypothetical protein
LGNIWECADSKIGGCARVRSFKAQDALAENSSVFPKILCFDRFRGYPRGNWGYRNGTFPSSQATFDKVKVSRKI